MALWSLDLADMQSAQIVCLRTGDPADGPLPARCGACRSALRTHPIRADPCADFGVSMALGLGARTDVSTGLRGRLGMRDGPDEERGTTPRGLAAQRGE